MQYKYKLGVIPARFQTPILHAGHLTLIGTALQECEQVMILLGISDKIDSRNPYIFSERWNVIKRVFPQVHIYPIKDVDSDIQWSNDIDNLISHQAHHLDSDIRLYHSRDSFKEVYSGKYQLVEVPEIQGYSATKIREQLNIS